MTLGFSYVIYLVMDAILRLKKRYFLLLSILLSEAFTSLMSIILKGRITYDYLITGGVVSLIVASIVIYLVAQSQRVLFEKDVLQHEIDERKRAEDNLRNTLNEKEVLLKEVHHRVKNNMAIISSLLALQSRDIDNKEYLGMLNECQSRIKSMALVHEKLYQSEDFAHINVKDYIETLSESIRSAFMTSCKVTCKVDVDDIYLDIDFLIPCGLLINEILTNAYKHAFCVDDNPELIISMKRADNENIKLTIADNGKGFPEGFDMDKAQRLGLKLVRILLKQINGELQVESENGVTFTINFPSAKKHARHLNNN